MDGHFEHFCEQTLAKNLHFHVFLVQVASIHRVSVFSERELTFTFAICSRPSVCRLSVTLVRPTQAVQIFGNISTALDTLAIR